MRKSEPPDIIFGRVLRKLRREADKSQEKLALDANLERTFISMLELGQRKPTLKTLIALAKALDKPLSEIMLVYESEFLSETGRLPHK
jgi:transcriptional regulator with XRE-family HTH domain